MKLTEILFVMALSMLVIVAVGFLSHYKIISTVAQAIITAGVCVAQVAYYKTRRNYAREKINMSQL